MDVLRLRFDPDEEIFQIARAAYCLDAHDSSVEAIEETVEVSGYASTMLRSQRRYLTDALLGRLMVLHRCVATMNNLQERHQQATAAADTGDASRTLFGAVAENELAAAALDDLNTDLLAMAEAYEDVGASANAQALHAR